MPRRGLNGDGSSTYSTRDKDAQFQIGRCTMKSKSSWGYEGRRTMKKVGCVLNGEFMNTWKRFCNAFVANVQVGDGQKRNIAT